MARRVIAGALALAVATMQVRSAQAMVGAKFDDEEDGRRDLLGQARYIALVSLGDTGTPDMVGANSVTVAYKAAAAECSNRASEINELKHSLQGDGINTMSFDTSSMSIATEACYVTFTGDANLRSSVEALPGVLAVEEDGVVRIQAAPPSWGLDRVDQRAWPAGSGTKYDPSHTGAGVNVFVVDTGINAQHIDFGGRARMGGDFVGETPTEDLNGHGSHCSGTVAGATYGVANGATVYGVKVLGKGGSGLNSGVVAGIQWAVDKQAEIAPNVPAVISLSLGGSPSTMLDRAVKAASDAGNIVVVAAGNSNQDACNASPARTGGSGREGGVITVGATDRYDRRASYSNYGSCVDIFAPGSSITSTWKGNPTATNTISGTSMATPHVAGAAAVFLEKNNMDKNAAVAEMFHVVLGGYIADVRQGSPNLFLNVPTYTGPPTPPTPAPTPPPTMPMPSVCFAGTDDCSPFAASLFGAGVPSDHVVVGPIVVSPTFLCGPISDVDWTGKVVLVDRGECLFYDKVMYAQRRGAIAVLIGQTSDDPVFAPAYYGTDTSVTIPSAMIPLASANEFRDHEGDMVSVGTGTTTRVPSPAPTTATPTNFPTLPRTPQPTGFPTIAPTPFPTTPAPTKFPTRVPTPAPTTAAPTSFPTRHPTEEPTAFPSKAPTAHPTTGSPTSFPTRQPTEEPTAFPSKSPTPRPTPQPSQSPTSRPTRATRLR